ncbi:MAG: protein-L-isoaspartate(D-aspartate) O-methyltransferase [Clostridiaceae bacterium]
MDYKALQEFYEKLDRSFFLEGAIKLAAYVNAPLSIGFGQTISQPSLVLFMTGILDPDKNSKVLEIGTGSGYQTALLAEFSSEVFTIEIIPELSKKAKKRLDEMNYKNIHYKVGDGSEGWSEFAPFDRIMVTAAAEVIPFELVQQLDPNGRMVIPIGPSELQELQVITKDKIGNIHVEVVELVRFVEMVGKYGWNRDK